MEYFYTNRAPKAIGPYSQAVKAGNMLFVSGQLPIEPDTGFINGDNIGVQAERALKNLFTIVEEAGCSVSSIAKITVYLKNMADFQEFNIVYEKALDGHKPARAVVGVSELPKDALLEVDAICVK